MVNHIKSKKHDEEKDRIKQKRAREADIVKSLAKYDQETNRKGATLPGPEGVQSKCSVSFHGV